MCFPFRFVFVTCAILLKNFIRIAATRRGGNWLYFPVCLCQAWWNECIKEKKKNDKITERMRKSERERKKNRKLIFLLSLILWCFMCFSLQSSWLFQDQKMYPELKVQTLNSMNSSSHKKINHENFRLNVYEYYPRERKDANAFAAAALDRGHNIAARNTLGNVNSKPTKAFDHVNFKYDESALSRCALLFIGALCQQGKWCHF